MVIRNFYLVWLVITPHKADAVLVINTNAILSSTVATEHLQLIAWWQPQFRQ
jgi:hypothetical protein